MNIVMNSFETTEQAREFHAYYNRISMNNGVGGQGKIKSQTPSPNDSVGSPRVSPYSRPKIGGGSGRKLKQEAVGGGYVPNGCWSTSVSLANEGGPLNGALTQSTPPTTVTGIGALGFEPTPSQNDLVCWQNPPISYPTQNVSPTSPVPASAPNSLGHCHETEFQNYPGGGGSNSYSSYNYHQDSLYQFQPYPNLPLNPNELSFHHQQQQQHHHHHHPYYGQGLQPPELHHHMSNISSPVLVKAEQHSPPSQELIQSRLAMTPQPADLNVSDDQQLAVASSSNPGGNWSPLTPPEIGKSTDSTLQRVNWHGRESAQS